MAAPVLYSFRRCPYAMRARLALQAAGVEVELRDIALKAKPASGVMGSQAWGFRWFQPQDYRVKTY